MPHYPNTPIPSSSEIPCPVDESSPLAERIASASSADRAGMLMSAVAAGESVELPGADLRGAFLRPFLVDRPSNGDAPEPTRQRVSLDGINLSGATLSGASMAGLSLRGACLDGALLVGADLTRTDLTGASLRGANLTGARLRRADLSFADLSGASLLTADLTEVTATGADLREALLQSTTLVRALLRSADLRWARLDCANLRAAELDGARFEGAVLALTNLNGARLSPTTDFTFAFLHYACFDRTDLARAHLGGGIGEEFSDLMLGHNTYQVLARHFAATGRRSDALWAYRRAWQIRTASHRPDRAARYYPPSDSVAAPAAVERGLVKPEMWRRLAARRDSVRFCARHGVLWALGLLTDLVTGYGTSLKRIMAALMATWLFFALVFNNAGAVIHLAGRAVGWPDILRYSAAALTPIDAYPLVATTEAARAAAVAEGMVGMVLLGALGYVAVSRMWRG